MKLRLSVTDTVDIMFYASEQSPGKAGCAVWDIFPAEAMEPTRLFLRRKFDKTHKFTDPIHSQLFYLDPDLRKELHDRHGVESWRVYQYPVSTSPSSG